MKLINSILLLSIALFVNTQLQAHDSYWKNSSGTYVKNSSGNCWMTGSHVAEEAKCSAMDMSKHQHAAMAKSSTDSTDEPEIKEVINLKGVTFKTESDEINPSSFTRLNISAKDLKRNPDLKVIVAGHTDNMGDPAFNQELSLKRAEAVKAYLIDKGIDSSRLIARGYGDSQPAASNDTQEGRAKNRRVELRIH